MGGNSPKAQKANHKVQVMIVSADLKKDNNFFLSMDPYYEIQMGEQVIKSKPSYGKGKQPVWNDFVKRDHHLYFADEQYLPEENVEIRICNDGDVLSSATVSCSKLVCFGQKTIVKFD